MRGAAGTRRDLGPGAQPHGSWDAISALLVANEGPALPPPRVLSSHPKPHARALLYFHHELLAANSFYELGRPLEL
jgi:hypothetical protein